ncbi:MAG TPA: cytochrome c oxidase assembly protein [Solirubrobacteraceae bacterium]|jgi:putative membrane protein|nr:cytochrome c oxidase assembly protein [Solirubrobacteraceae bacterium]
MSSVPGWGSWSVVPLLWVGLLVAGTWYVSMLRRVQRVTGKPVGPGHWAFYFSGLAVLLLALGSPLNTLADHWLLSAHMLQHVLLADIAPPLLILGLRAPVLPLGMPAPMLKRLAHRGTLGRVWGVVTKPWIALPLWAATLLTWSVPPVFDYTAQHQLLHNFEHLTLFYTGFAMWWLIITPLPTERREPGFARLAYIGFSRVASAIVCVPLAFLGTTLYPLYVGIPQAYGISAITDQRIAGASVCLVEFLVFGIAMAVVFVDALNREERAQVLTEMVAASH